MSAKTVSRWGSWVTLKVYEVGKKEKKINEYGK